jgi:hypothetical protein
MELVACRSAWMTGVVWPTIWRERHEFCCLNPYAAGISGSKAGFDLDIAALCPS